MKGGRECYFSLSHEKRLELSKSLIRNDNMKEYLEYFKNKNNPDYVKPVKLQNRIIMFKIFSISSLAVINTLIPIENQNILLEYYLGCYVENIGHGYLTKFLGFFNNIIFKDFLKIYINNTILPEKNIIWIIDNMILPNLTNLINTEKTNKKIKTQITDSIKQILLALTKNKEFNHIIFNMVINTNPNEYIDKNELISEMQTLLYSLSDEIYIHILYLIDIVLFILAKATIEETIIIQLFKATIPNVGNNSLPEYILNELSESIKPSEQNEPSQQNEPIAFNKTMKKVVIKKQKQKQKHKHKNKNEKI